MSATELCISIRKSLHVGYINAHLVTCALSPSWNVCSLVALLRAPAGCFPYGIMIPIRCASPCSNRADLVCQRAATRIHE